MTPPCRPSVLIAEDDPDDRLLLEVAFNAFKDSLEVHFVKDGEELMEYLLQQRVDVEPASPQPELILLDLSMPKKDGRQALVDIKLDDNLKKIPVVVWTTSNTEEDIWLCGEAGADGYVTKPCNFVEMEAAIKYIGKFDEHFLSRGVKDLKCLMER